MGIKNNSHENISCVNRKNIKKSFGDDYQIFKLRSFSIQCFLAGLVYHGVSHADKYHIVAEYLGISDRTVRRYYDDDNVPPEPVSRLLYVQYCGFAQGCGWAGWKMRDGLLISPTNESVAPDLIGRIWLWRNEKAVKLDKIQRLEQENQRLRSQQSPDTMRKISDAASLINEVLQLKVAG